MADHLDALKWEQRVRPNGDVIAILAVADFRALVERCRQAEAEKAMAAETDRLIHLDDLEYEVGRLRLMLEAALEGQEAALASQESILNYSKVPGRHREAIEGARAAIRLTRQAALSLRPKPLIQSRGK